MIKLNELAPLDRLNPYFLKIFVYIAVKNDFMISKGALQFSFRRVYLFKKIAQTIKNQTLIQKEFIKLIALKLNLQ